MTMGAANSPEGINFGTQSDWFAEIVGVTRETHKSNTIYNFGGDYNFKVDGQTYRIYVGDMSVNWQGVQVKVNVGWKARLISAASMRLLWASNATSITPVKVARTMQRGTR